MKKLLLTIITATILFALFSCTQNKHYDETNIDELYDKEMIVGKTRAEIEKEYGEFNREFISDDGKDLGAYYVNYDNKGIDPSYIHDTYFVVFDSQGIAIDAYFSQTSKGG